MRSRQGGTFDFDHGRLSAATVCRAMLCDAQKQGSSLEPTLRRFAPRGGRMRPPLHSPRRMHS